MKRYSVCIVLLVMCGLLMLTLFGCSGSTDQKELADVNKSAKLEQQYREELLDNSEKWGQSFIRLGTILENPKVDSGNNFDETWKQEVKNELEYMEGLVKETREINPPSKYKEAHELYMKGIEEYKWAIDNLPVALDSMDLGLLEQCSSKIEKGSYYTGQARKKLKAIHGTEQE